MTKPTPEILRAALPNLTKANAQMVVDHIGPAIQRYDISNPKRLAAFLGQCAHESALFSRKIENLNYSAQGLISTWPTRFNAANAAEYARKPTKIANRVYANRMGNGSEASGEPALYIGRAFIQLTGKDNYSRFAFVMGKTLPETIKYLETDEGAFMASAWFWHDAGLNKLADGWQLTNISKRVNGGSHGLAERIKYSNALHRALTPKPA